MKNKFCLLVLLSVFLAGCGHSDRSSGSYLGQITRHPDRYLGATISVFGTVVSVDHTDEGTRFRIATVNYAYVFDVTYPGDVPKLVHDKDAYFLGRVSGSEKSSEAYSGVIVKVDALAVRPVGAKPTYQPENRRLAQEWMKGKLELAEVQTQPGVEEGSNEMAMESPTPAPSRPRAQPATSTYPGLEGLAEPVQLAPGAAAAYAAPAPAPAYAPPAPAYAEAAPAPAYATQASMGPPPPPPTAANMAAPAPPPMPLPSAPAAAAPVSPANLTQAESADLRLLNAKWNDLPDDVKTKIVRDIEQRTQFSDLTMIAQNWHSLPEDAKAAILKLIIESAR